MADNLPVPVEAQAAGATEAASSHDSLRMSFFEHLGELRKRLMWSAGALVICAGVVWNFLQPVFDYLLRPLSNLPNVHLILLTPLEMFLTYIKVAIVGGALLATPFILLQLWLFVSPGLYSHEKRWVFPFIFSGTTFFVGGAAFCFYLVLPATFKFMVEMVPMSEVRIENTYSVGSYLSLVTQLMLAFGAVFELPLVMVILAAAGLVTAKQYGAFRKYWVVIAAIIGGILTPTPDPMTQMMMAAPLYGFYELGIFASRFVEGRRNKADAPPASAA